MKTNFVKQNIWGNFLTQLGSKLITFECEMSLGARDCQGGDTAVVLLVESVAQDLPRHPLGLLPGEDDGVAVHRAGLDVRRGVRDWK